MVNDEWAKLHDANEDCINKQYAEILALKAQLARAEEALNRIASHCRRDDSSASDIADDAVEDIAALKGKAE